MLVGGWSTTATWYRPLLLCVVNSSARWCYSVVVVSMRADWRSRSLEVCLKRQRQDRMILALSLWCSCASGVGSFVGGYFLSPLMREGFCLTKSAQFLVAPADAERGGEEVRK